MSRCGDFREFFGIFPMALSTVISLAVAGYFDFFRFFRAWEKSSIERGKEYIARKNRKYSKPMNILRKEMSEAPRKNTRN